MADDRPDDKSEDKAGYDAKMEECHRWNKVIGESLVPLMTTDVGVIAARVFYAIRHPDGTESVVNLGITPEGDNEVAARLLASIIALISDPMGNRSYSMHEQGKKH